MIYCRTSKLFIYVCDFRRKTTKWLRISGWSSDVCSSDLTFKFFWEGAHPGSGLAPDRRTTRDEPVDDLAAIGGTGFGVMALIVAAERGWVTRDAAVERLNNMLAVLARATCYHGAYPHFLNGATDRKSTRLNSSH